LRQNSLVFQRFLAEAGGANAARIVYVPTNGGGSYNTPEERQRELDAFLTVSGWRNLANPVVLIHTYDRNVANTVAFYGPIDSCTGIFFAGGRPFWSTDTYLGTATEAALDRLLRRGGVVGGSSAGALMQSNVMARGSRQTNAIVLAEPFIGFGFGQMQNIVIDVHNLQRNRAHDLLEVFFAYPTHLGINVDEDTAAIMKGDILEVSGTGWVQIFDPTLWQPATEAPWCGNFPLSMGTGRPLVPGHGKSFFLWGQRSSGPDRYNVNTRTIVSALSKAEIDALQYEDGQDL